MACIAYICNVQIICTELIFTDDMTDKQKRCVCGGGGGGGGWVGR